MNHQKSQKTQRKEIEAYVLSNKMNKTLVVQVERLVPHPVYQKYYRKMKKMKVHDAKGECHVGDRVLIRESRPISREKSWAVCQILTRAQVVESSKL